MVEVAEAISSMPGVKQASVYGVAISGPDGRAGMALLETKAGFDLVTLRAHLLRSMPSYTRPLFVRLRAEMKLTGRFKYAKTNLMKQAYDPRQVTDPIYFHDPKREAFVRVDREFHTRLQAAEFRL